MDAEEQRKIILKNWPRLVCVENMGNVMHSLGRQSNIVRDAYKDLQFNDDQHHNNRLILFMLLKLLKSPDIFDLFTKGLRRNGCITEANLLEGKRHLTCRFQNYDGADEDTVPIDMSVADVTPLTIRVTCADQFLDQDLTKCYRTRSRNRGRVLIINNIEFDHIHHRYRKGAKVDEQNLEELFKNCGFDVRSYQNRSANQIDEEVTNFASQQPYSSSPDICFCIIMSHGELDENNRTIIFGSDGGFIFEDDIIKKFTNSNCPLFKGRPKVIIINICRSPHEERTETDACQRTKGREISDLLICHPSLLGTKSNRDIHRGAWYIEILCDVFMKNAYKEDVMSMLGMVDTELSKRFADKDGKTLMQTSTFESQGFKLCYLHPGIYEDDNHELKRFNELL